MHKITVGAYGGRVEGQKDMFTVTGDGAGGNCPFHLTAIAEEHHQRAKGQFVQQIGADVLVRTLGLAPDALNLRRQRRGICDVEMLSRRQPPIVGRRAGRLDR